eukprot:SAG11_NODE_3669_length_2296_cov_1.153846_4_plen_100_part_00
MIIQLRADRGIHLCVQPGPEVVTVLAVLRPTDRIGVRGPFMSCIRSALKAVAAFFVTHSARFTAVRHAMLCRLSVSRRCVSSCRRVNHSANAFKRTILG